MLRAVHVLPKQMKVPVSGMGLIMNDRRNECATMKIVRMLQYPRENVPNTDSAAMLDVPMQLYTMQNVMNIDQGAAILDATMLLMHEENVGPMITKEHLHAVYLMDVQKRCTPFRLGCVRIMATKRSIVLTRDVNLLPELEGCVRSMRTMYERSVAKKDVIRGQTRMDFV